MTAAIRLYMSMAFVATFRRAQPPTEASGEPAGRGHSKPSHQHRNEPGRGQCKPPGRGPNEAVLATSGPAEFEASHRNEIKNVA